MEELNKILEQRLAEFAEARNTYFNKALGRLNGNPQMLPEWVELRGVFRFAHPFDSPAKWHEQQQESEKARQRLLNGEDFAVVAREMSQGGTKDLGGKLGRRYLNPQDPADQIIAKLAPNKISPVIEVNNGYWSYQVEAKGKSQLQPFAEAPWPARRILFRLKLIEVMSGS